jgi:hypothetical protein
MFVIARNMLKTFIGIKNFGLKQRLFEHNVCTFLFHDSVAASDGCRDSSEGDRL